MLTRLLGASLLVLLTSSVTEAQQVPPVQNGRVETQPATSVATAISAIGTNADPVWMGWLVPMIQGEHNLCSQWVPDAGAGTLRIATLELSTPGTPPAGRPPAVRLEGGTSLVVLARITGGRVDRVRTLDDECPIDAGGRTVHWLTGITTAASLQYLDALVRDMASTVDGQRRIATSAVTAIALHRDPAADALLDRLVAPGTPEPMSRHVAMWIGSTRGAHGFDTLSTRIRTEADPRLRRTFVNALGQTREARTADALLTLAERDPDAGVRAEAVYWYAVRAQSAALPNLMTIIGQDRDDAVKRRAVSSLGLVAADTSVPALIQLARSNASPVVRKEAVSTLGRSTDARARSFLEEIVAR